MHAPNGGGDLLAITGDPKLVKPTLAGTFKWTTKGGWFFTCLSTLRNGEGEGFIGYAPDGTKYTFDWMATRAYPGISKKDPSRLYGTLIDRSSVRIHATRVEDRFGNWVTYDWTGDRLNRIYANDGREITLNYATDNGRLLTATAAGRTWTYEYLPPDSLALSAVINPDGSRWQYGSSGTPINRVAYAPNPHGPPQYVVEYPAACAAMSTIQSATAIFTITHPSGAQAEYTLGPLRHGRTNVPYDCMEGTDDDWRSDYNNFAVFHDVMSLQSKRITGPGLVDAAYTYAYASLEGGYAPLDSYTDALTGATPPPHYKYVTVTEPDGTQLVNTFGKDFGLSEGQLLKVEVRKAGVTYKTTTSTYVSETEIAAQPFSGYVGSNLELFEDAFNSAALRPQRSTTIVQDGATFSSNTNAFDAQARPLSVTQSSSLGYARTRVTAYHDNLSSWVLGQVKTVTQASPLPSLEISRTDYDAATDLPWKTYSNGLLLQTLAYYADGTLQTVTDPRNNPTSLSGWKRGIPQLITFADAKTKSAVVHDAGWIDSVTDENGYTTAYGHDTMGRLTSVTQPVGDALNWNTTTQTFAPAATSEYGIPGGHWKQTFNTGNARKVTYFDALWRPLVMESYDNANKFATLSQTVTRYDVSGHPIFQSYPSSNVSDYASIIQGIRTSYDALDRVTQVEQDSELGILTTRTEYLAGFQRRTTNPRNWATTESFQAFGVPSYDTPVLIKTPKSTATIERDGFGKPTATTRAGP